jgi:hypothetical protein
LQQFNVDEVRWDLPIPNMKIEMGSSKQPYPYHFNSVCRLPQFLLMHFLDYNNVGGVRWTSISELCIIEIYLLLAPHVNTINEYEVCEGRC